MTVTESTTLGELKSCAEIAPLFPYLIYNCAGDGAGRFTDDSVTLRALQKKDPTWYAGSMAYGLNTYIENTRRRKELIFSVYDAAACEAEPDKKNVKLIFFPAVRGENEEKKTAVLAAGGAYGAVCSLTESFPVAAEMSRQGVDVFCLNYRVADGSPLFPRPMEDMRSSVRFLIENSAALGIDMTRYAVGGFSAGAHLAASYGTRELGYARDGLPKPELMILVYPLINLWKTTALMPEPVRGFMRRGYLGENAVEECCRIYNIDECVTESYPATWMIQSLDDPVVPIWNTGLMENALKSRGVPYNYEKPVSGGHGWGPGTSTPAAGWTERMLLFWEVLRLEK